MLLIFKNSPRKIFPRYVSVFKNIFKKNKKALNTLTMRSGFMQQLHTLKNYPSKKINK